MCGQLLNECNLHKNQNLITWMTVAQKYISFNSYIRKMFGMLRVCYCESLVAYPTYVIIGG
jgi:hypothetical protein